MLEREPSGIGATVSIAREALAAAERATDPFATAQALIDLWLAHSM
jgi:hypothetical protein